MKLKQVGIIILCIIVVIIISIYKSIEQKRVEQILNEEIDIRLEGVEFEDFKVYHSNMCDNSNNIQCPYPSKPYYNSFF